MKRLESAQQHRTRRSQLAVREHAGRSLRRAVALALVDHLEQVAAKLRQTSDVNTYMVAAAGMARVLVVLSLGAHQFGRPLPPAVIDAIPELHRWAVSVKAQARLAGGRERRRDPWCIRASEPDSYPPNGSEAGKPRGQVRAELPGLGRTRTASRNHPMRRRRRRPDPPPICSLRRSPAASS